jgi:hypothetical protein
MHSGVNIKDEVGITLGRSYPRAVDADARGENAASEAPRRDNAADEDDSRLSGLRRCGSGGVLLRFHVEASVIVAASIGECGGAEVVAQEKQHAEEKNCHCLLHVGIS